MSDFPDLPVELDRRARLPEVYEAARVALERCDRIDECQDWADKAEALASYARQSKDNELRAMADRIQARAARRCGELLKEIEPAPGARTDLEPKDGTAPRSRTQAATEAGLSERQRKTALRVADIPKPEFEAAVEAPNPPTVTALADRGRLRNPRKPSPLGMLGALWKAVSKEGRAVFVERHRREIEQYLASSDCANQNPEEPEIPTPVEEGSHRQARRVLEIVSRFVERTALIDLNKALLSLRLNHCAFGRRRDGLIKDARAARNWLDRLIAELEPAD